MEFNINVRWTRAVIGCRAPHPSVNDLNVTILDIPLYIIYFKHLTTDFTALTRRTFLDKYIYIVP